MRVLHGRPKLVPVFIAAIVFLATMLGTHLGWLISKKRVERQLYEIGEIYLDGMVASIKTAHEAGSQTEVARRLRAAFTEQRGIEERLLVVSDSAGTPTNIAGRKELATAAVLNTEPGSYAIDFEANTLVVARRLDDNKSRAIAVLSIERIMRNYSLARWSTIGVDAAVAAVASLAALLLMFGAGMFGNAKSPKANVDAL